MKKINTYSFLLFLLLSLNQLTLKAQWLVPIGASSVIGASSLTTSGTLSPQTNAYAVSPTTGKIFIAAGAAVHRYLSSAKEMIGAAPEQMLSGAGVTIPVGDIYDLVIDKDDNLWIVDSHNHRVLKYINASTITDLSNPVLVLGQPDLATATNGIALNKFKFPTGIVIRGNFLYISDRDNHRVLRFDHVSALAVNGATASVVLGNGVASTTESTFHMPYKLFVDGDDHLWVADAYNNRVLKFNGASTLASGAEAALVLGQTNFTSNTTATTAVGFSTPTAVVVDGLKNVYVADYSNNRVLIYQQPRVNGAAANFVIGQGDFTTNNTYLPSPNSLARPFGLYASNDYLAVVSAGDSRVMIIRPDTPLPVQLSSFSAKHASNGRINFTWETASEHNNDYFELLVSEDGKAFSRIATVDSKVSQGTSSMSTKYTYAWNVTELSVASFGLLSLLLLPAFKRRWTKIVLVVLVTASFVSCEKDLNDENQSIKYAKLIQVDKDGARTEVKVITIN
jgi:hypothetical protein